MPTDTSKRSCTWLENPEAARKIAERGKKTTRSNVSGSEIAKGFHEYVRTELLGIGK